MRGKKNSTGGDAAHAGWSWSGSGLAHARTREHEERRGRLLEWDGGQVQLDGGFVIRLSVKECHATLLRPLGLAYSFVLLGPGEDGPATRFYALDNAHAPDGAKHPYDHEHKTKYSPTGSPVGVHSGSSRSVEDVLQLLEDFLVECARRLHEWGISSA